jgi:hypothetical protein
MARAVTTPQGSGQNAKMGNEQVPQKLMQAPIRGRQHKAATAKYSYPAGIWWLQAPYRTKLGRGVQ